MKKALLFLIIVPCAQLFAQTNPITAITITLPANPDAVTANWGTGTNIFTITATAQSVGGRVDASVEESKILVIIKKNGSKICGAYTGNTAPAANFNSISKVWNGNNAAALIGQECTLLPGDYELSVQFFGYSNAKMVAISDEKIKPFTIKGNDQQAYQPPHIIMPPDGTVIGEADILKPITFRWTPVVPRPADAVTYRLKVWQLMQGQNGTQAMRANQPIITKDVDNITQAIISNLVSSPCKPPYMCSFVWDVQALDKQGKPIGNNNGTSETTAFNTGATNTNAGGGSKSHSPNSGACGPTSTKTYHSGDIISLSGDFKMKLTADPTGTNDSLCGKGTVSVKWIGLMKVQFKGIKVDNTDKLCTGTVYTSTDSTQTYPTQWAVNVLNNTSAGAWTINKIKSLCKYIQTNKNLKPLVKATDQVDNTIATNPISMPLGYFKNSDSSNALGFTEMVFKPTKALFTVIASLNTSKIFKNDGNTFNGTDTIALQGTDIEFTNAGLKRINGEIKLLSPITFTYANTNTENLKLTLNTEDSGHIGNSVVFSDTSSEYWKYNFDATVQLPKEWLTPVDTTKTNVDLNFQAIIEMWDDFIVTGNLAACTVPHTNGLGIDAGTLVFDHSEISNVDDMEFPEGYSNDTSEMFTGFYLKDFKLTLPDQLRTYADTSKVITIGAENLVIDKHGLSGKIYANNVINYPNGNIGNLGASIDTVNVRFNNSVLTEAKMLGKITLPMSSADSANAIRYSAMFASTNNSGAGSTDTSTITFSLIPDRDIKSRFFGDGFVQIDQTSSLNLTLTKIKHKKRGINLQVDLNGKLSYPTGKILDLGSTIPLDLDLSCSFEHLGMGYVKDTAEKFTFNVGHWSFASPQKKLSGFAFNITNVNPKIEPVTQSSEKQYIFKGGVEFVAKINIGSENSNIAIAGDTKIALTGAIESAQYTPPSGTGNTQAFNTSVFTAQSAVISGGTNTSNAVANVKKDYGFLTQLKPQYLGVTVESINIDAHLPAVYIKGSVDFYKHDPVYGNGFKGDLTAKFTTLELGIQAGAIFGNTKYIPGHTTGFKYWMVQAQVNLPPPGIVFMTGVAFRGFGAGVYSRMQMTPPATFDATAANSSTFGGATFTPCDTVSIGFKVKAIIATTPKEETFNGSVALGAEFNTSGGINFIQIDGLFNCGSKIGQESTGFANGIITVRYDFPNKIFDMSSQLNIHKYPIQTGTNGIQTKLHIDGLNNKWFFKCGVPTNPNKVSLFGVAINSYFEFGNNIEIPQGFMQETRDGFASIGYSLPGFNDHATGDGQYQSAKGFAFGIGLNYHDANSWNITSFDGYICQCHRYLDATYSISAGGEVDASFLQYSGCTGLGEGWRAKASMAVYAGASIGYKYSLPGFGDNSGTLGSVVASAYATAEFPNPTYFDGQLNGDFSICDYSIGFHTHFTYGSQCNGTPVVDANTNQNVYSQQNVSDSLNYSLINNILTPGGTSGISRTTNFSALLNYPYNEPFDVQEQQSSGQMKVRTFRAYYTTVLTQDSTTGTFNAANGAMLQGAAVHADTQTTQHHINETLQNHNGVVSNNALHPVLANPQVSHNNNNIVHQATANMGTISTNGFVLDTYVDLTLMDGGADEMGARLFRLAALTNGGIANAPDNALKANTSYKFQITGALQEYINGGWVAVNHKNTTAPVKQVMSMYFKTNSDGVSNSNNR